MTFLSRCRPFPAVAPFLAVVAATLLAPSAPAQGWLAEPELLPVPPQAQGVSGRALAIDGDVLVVGASQWPLPSMPRAGSVELLRRQPGWTHVLRMTASDAASNSYFGTAVDVSGGLVIVGAPQSQGTGAAYLFSTTNGLERERFVPAEVTSGDQFGGSVAASGAFYAVAAPNYAGTAGIESGAVWLYRANVGLVARLVGSDTTAEDRFGTSIAMDGNLLVVGARTHGTPIFNCGAAYVFDVQGNELQKLTASDPSSADIFGISVAIDGETILVCSKDAAYVFVPSGGGWVQQARLDAGWPNGTNAQMQGAISGDRIVLGLPQHDGAVGRAALYERVGTSWILRDAVVGPGATGDFFGLAVAIDGARVAIGSPFEQSAAGDHTGGVYPHEIDLEPAFCNGEALHACPCGNVGDLDAGCDNPQGTGGVKAEFVAVDRNASSASLLATGFPPNGSPTAIVIRSPSLEAVPQPFFDGVRCISTSGFVRLSASTANGGASRHDLVHGAGPGTFHYQVWYRSPPEFCTHAPSNVSSGDSLTW